MTPHRRFGWVPSRVRAVCEVSTHCTSAQVLKIKAHQEVAQCNTLKEKYHAVGNALAGQAANFAREHGLHDSQDSIVQVSSTPRTARSNARKAIAFVANATPVYTQACEHKRRESEPPSKRWRAGQVTTVAEEQAALLTCSIDAIRMHLPTLPGTGHQYEFWGVRRLTALRMWLQRLQRPSTRCEPENCLA